MMLSNVDKRFNQVRIGLLAVGFACLSACSSGGVSSLVGQYSTTEGGQVELIITRIRGEPFATALEGKKWSEPEKLVECTEKDYADLFGANWRDLKVRGLRGSNGQFAIFRVQKGATNQRRTFKTGYVLLWILGAADLYRV